jgi:FK506-binding protein 4/5
MQAAKYIEYDNAFSEDEKIQTKALKFTCNLNNAACKLKLKEYREAAKLCSKVNGHELIHSSHLV